MKTPSKSAAEQTASDIAELERRKSRLPEGDPYRVMLDRWIAETK